MRLAKALLYVLPSFALAAGTVTLGVVAASGIATPAYAAKSEQTISNPKLAKPLKAVQDLIQKKKLKKLRPSLEKRRMRNLLPISSLPIFRSI
jgi:hypothetical protein